MSYSRELAIDLYKQCAKLTSRVFSPGPGHFLHFFGGRNFINVALRKSLNNELMAWFMHIWSIML